MSLAGTTPRTLAANPVGHPSSLRGLRGYQSEALNGEAKEQAADQRDREELWPDHVDARTAIED